MSDMEMELIGPQPSKLAERNSTAYLARAFRAIREGASFAAILRLGGSGLMVFSLSLFLLQGMDTASDLQRYLLLLGQTMLLTGAGFAVGYVLNEPRGARAFFSLALVSIPAIFAVLGAMIYSMMSSNDIVTQYPAYASWQSTNVKELLIAVGAGYIVLIPMAVFCFAVLARHLKWWLSAAYLLACSALLIPLRDSLSTTVLCSVCVLIIVTLLSRQQAKRQRVTTPEERFAKALLFAPAVLILARSAALYNVDFYSALAVVVAVYFQLRRIVAQRSTATWLASFIPVISAACAVVLSGMIATLINNNLPFIAPALTFTLVLLVLNIDLVRFIDFSRLRATIHGFWAVVCFIAIAVDSLIFGSSMGFIVNLVLSVILLVASTFTRQRLGALLGAIALSGVLISNGSDLLASVLNAGWMGVAIAGATAIVAGSVLERFWPVMKIRLADQFSVTRVLTSDIDDLELAENMTSKADSIQKSEPVVAYGA